MSDDYDPRDDMNKSVDACYEAIRKRVAAGGPAWTSPPIPLRCEKALATCVRCRNDGVCLFNRMLDEKR